MKPLLKKDIKSFLDRFDSFKDAMLESFNIIDSKTIELKLQAQDRAQEFNWVELTLSFNSVSDATLVENSKLTFVDMSDGITLRADKFFEFALGSYSDIRSSECFIVADFIKYT